MNNMDLDTLVTEYESALGNLEEQRKVLERYERAFNATADALVEGIQDAGLVEYGPFTSCTFWHESSMTHRRVWSTKKK